MAVYDPVLVGWGIDWWFLHALGPDLRGRVAVVDEVPCVNPHDRDKGGLREIDRLQPAAERVRTWEAVRLRHRIPDDPRAIVEYGRLPLPRLLRAWRATRRLAARASHRLRVGAASHREASRR